jgi:N-acetylmuramoyl-L-alanine amidase
MCVNCFGRRRFAQLAFGLAATGLSGVAPARATIRTPETLPLVMLDPGHGGHDPGAIAPDGVYEKHITLATGLTLRTTLLATKRYRVQMTRTHDVFIPLEDRVTAAVQAGADLFLALHCDHLPEPSLRGASFFTLSNTASDDLAAGIADDENGTGVAGAPLAGVSPQVASILASLETRATKVGSATLAQDLKNSFKGVIPLLPDPRRSANFAVLRDPSTPSTLLEMGCLTNPLDEKRLRSPMHRKMMAAKITTAIDMYFAHFAGGRMAG